MGLTIWTERIGTTTLGIDLQALAQPIYRQTLWAHLASMPRLKSTGTITKRLVEDQNIE